MTRFIDGNRIGGAGLLRLRKRFVLLQASR
jgi:hypothetical protein